MYLHNDNELFRDVITLVSERVNHPQDIVEKDYYVTMILKKLSTCAYPVCFKGGTSLSKAYGVLDRFSEDIDITFTEHLGEKKRKKLKYNILKPLVDELSLDIVNWNSIESDKDYNHYDIAYRSVVDEPLLATYVKLETALMSYAFPTMEHDITNYIYLALKDEEPDFLQSYELIPFKMRVQALERTFIDKVFALCDYYIQNKAARNSRHLYDIYKMSDKIIVNDDFRNLVEEVRCHRQSMKNNIAPAADKSINIYQLIQTFCEEDFYEDDYEMTTKNLISDNVSYNEVKAFFLEFTKNLF